MDALCSDQVSVQHRWASQVRSRVSPKKRGNSPNAGLSLGFCSPFQHCGGKYSVHTPSWHGLITLSSPSHEQHIENASNSSQDNREICWELNTPAYLSRIRVPRNCHIQQITQAANYLQNCSSRYSQAPLLPSKACSLTQRMRASQGPLRGMWETYKFGEE